MGDQDAGAVSDGDAAKIEVEEALGSTIEMLRGGGSRIASDGLGPSLAFYVGFRTAGLGLGVVLAVTVAVAAWVRARRQGRTGLLAWLTLAVVLVQAAIGLVLDDARGFFAPQLVTSAAWGIAFVGSVAIGRPLAGVFAGEVYPFPDEVRATRTFRRIFGTISLVFGVSILLRGLLRLVQLRNGDIDGYLLVTLLTGFPVTALTIVWALWWARRSFARSEEWGWAFPPTPG